MGVSATRVAITPMEPAADKPVTVSVRLTPAQWAEVKGAARRRNLSASALLREVLTGWRASDYQQQGEHMSTNTAQMRARLTELGNEMADMAAAARHDGRAMTAEEQARFSGVDAEFKALEMEIDRAERLENVQRTLAMPQARVTVPTDLATITATAPSRAGATSCTLGDHADTVKALVMFARTGVRSFQNAMSIGTDADGGFEVPIQLDRDLQAVAANVSPLLRLCKVVDGVTDGYRANVATTHPASAWRAEGDTRAVTASPVLAQIVPQRGAVTAVVQASQWVMQDAAHDLYTFLISELGRQFGAAIGAAITTGAAAQPAPKGLTAQTLAATADATRDFGTVEYIATGGASTAPTLDNCITALSHLHPFYQANAAWLMSPSAAAALMTQKASTAGSYLWQPDLSASQPPTLFGKPVYIDPTLPAATTGNAYSVWIGDWQRAYVVARYGRPILIRDDVTVKGQVLLYSEQRIGGNVTDSSALKAIKTAAS